MTSITIVEGPDGAGKTTMALEMVNALEEVEHVVYIHNDASDANLPGSLYKHYRAQMLDAADRRKDGVSTVIDRSFLSEVIYGRHFRGKSRISTWQAHKLQGLAKQLGINLVGVWAPLDTRRRRIRERGEQWTEHDAFIGAYYSVWFRRNSRYWMTVERSSALNNK